MKRKRRCPPSAKVFTHPGAQRVQTRLKATGCGRKLRPATVRRL